MTYTVIDGNGGTTVYEGFCHYSEAKAKEGLRLAVISFDGSIDIWLVDGKAGQDSLNQMYKDEYGEWPGMTLWR